MTLVETIREDERLTEADFRGRYTPLAGVAALDGHHEQPAPYRIRIVGCSELVMHGLKILLGRSGSGAALFVDIESFTPADVDIVLVDASGGTRVEAQVREFVALGFDCVVACGWGLTSQEEERFRRAGATDYLSWRLSASELLTAIERLADRPRPARTQANTDPAQHRVDLVGCSVREVEILTLICRGLSNQEIADELYLSINTVKTYIRGAYRKIGVRTRSRAVIWGLGHGVLGTPADLQSRTVATTATTATAATSDTNPAAGLATRLSRSGSRINPDTPS